MVIIGVMFTTIPVSHRTVKRIAVGLRIQGMDWLNNRKVAMGSVCLVEVWRTAGFHMIIYLACAKIDSCKDYFEAAKVDGADIFSVCAISFCR